MRGKSKSKIYTYANPPHALAFPLSEQEQLRMLQTLPGFLQHCDAGACFFIDKQLSKRVKGTAWLREQIERKIRTNAKHYGHTLEDWVVDQLLEAAMEYLDTRSSKDLVGLLVYVRQDQDMATKLGPKTRTQPNSATAEHLRPHSCCAGLLEICV